MTNTSKYQTFLEANNENIENTFKKIQQYAEASNYRVIGEMKIPTTLGIKKSLHFDSKRDKKVLRWYITTLDKKVTLRQANGFLYFLFRDIYKLDKSPEILLSEKELKIQAARKAWKKAAAEAEKLRVAYRTEKGDFYKKKNLENNLAA